MMSLPSASARGFFALTPKQHCYRGTMIAISRDLRKAFRSRGIHCHRLDDSG